MLSIFGNRIVIMFFKSNSCSNNYNYALFIRYPSENDDESTDVLPLESKPARNLSPSDSACSETKYDDTTSQQHADNMITPKADRNNKKNIGGESKHADRSREPKDSIKKCEEEPIDHHRTGAVTSSVTRPKPETSSDRNKSGRPTTFHGQHFN